MGTKSIEKPVKTSAKAEAGNRQGRARLRGSLFITIIFQP
jgi:hypothetical protein